MKIAIDCRLIGRSGIGTFIENVVDNMIKTQEVQFLLIGNKNALSAYVNAPNCRIVECNLGIFTLKELLLFPVREVNKCDVFFTPNFNIPAGIKIPICATIHDIVFFDVENFSSFLHRLILRWYVKRAIKIADKLFTVSNFSRQRIQEYFQTSRDITVVCNGLSAELLNYKATRRDATQRRAGIVYLGNIKRHKGIHVLWKAYKRLLDEGKDAPRLTIIGRFDFRTKDNEILKTIQENKEKIRLVTDADNRQVYELLSQAQCLISPSLYEGFGIPPLEAMSLGTPVILSDIPVYKEIYGKFPVTFFKAGDSDDLYRKLLDLPSAPIQVDNLIEATYSYKITAQTIIKDLCPTPADTVANNG